MSGTASSRAEAGPSSHDPRVGRRLWPAWAVFAAVNVALMFVLPGEETIPFHFVWISLTLVYGLEIWPTARTVVVLVGVCVLTGLALVYHVQRGVIGWEETTEVPLMAMVFMAMVVHVRRRTTAAAAAKQSADDQRRMRDAQRDIVRFASHELRTPVTVARGFTELIVGADSIEQIHQDAEVVLGELGKLEMLSKRFVALAQADERIPIHPEPVDLDLLIQHTVDRWRPVAKQTWSVLSRIGTVLADADRLVVALDSVLDNAIRYGRPDGSISVVGVRDSNNALICIRDNGPGIAPDELPFVFERFRRGPRGGTGIGLAIVKAVADAHYGRVRAVSRRGVGSAVVISLPLDGPDSRSAPTALDDRQLSDQLRLGDLVEDRTHST